MSTSLVRAFLAVNFSVPATRRLAEAAGELKKQATAAPGLKVSWVPQANLHVTMKFLGEVEREVVDAIVPRLRRTLTAVQPFELRASGVGAYPSFDEARVLWLGVDGGPALTALQAQLEGDLEELGFRREERPFSPHVTIGRVREGKLPTLTLAKPEITTSRVTEVVLYESRPQHKGAEYVALGRIALGAVAQAAS